MPVENVHFSNVLTLSGYIRTDGWSDWGPIRLISRKDIQHFADLTNNHQWIHEDDSRCAVESPYGELIAHGVLLVSLMPSLLPEESFRVVGHAVRIIRAIDALRLPAPVFPGNSVHTRVRLLKVYHAQSGKGVVIERQVEVWSLCGTKPAVVCVLKMQYF